MKQNYEASRATISLNPYHTFSSRTQAFLLYPAKGRSAEQHLKDYQELAAATKDQSVLLGQLQSAYVIGMARNTPDKAMNWARQNIAGFDSKPQVRNTLMTAWQRHDQPNASRWINNHPELNITVATPVQTVLVARLLTAVDQRETTVTLPR